MPGALREIEAALLPLLTCKLSDLVAYGEMTFSGWVLEQGDAAADAALLRREY